MLPDASRLGFVALSSVGSGVLAVASEPALTGISEDHVALIASLVAFTTTVAGGLAWLDKRMERKIKAHEEAEFQKGETERKAREELETVRAKLEAERHEGILRELGHVKELVDLRGEIRRLREERKEG